MLHPTLLHGYSVRPIFLGCCALAVKMTCELHTSLSHLHSRVKDVFNPARARTAGQNRAPAPRGARLAACPCSLTAPRPRTFAAQPAPQCVCRCWAGGCPWGEGIISRTPTRSSARQRTRSRRRPTPCRPHRSFCRGKDLRKDLSEWVVDHVPWGHHAPTNGTPTYYGPVLWSRMVHTLGG